MDTSNTELASWQGLSSTILHKILNIKNPVAAFWALDCWLSAPLGRYPSYPFRWVHQEVAARWDVSRSTAKRAKVAALETFEEARPGHLTPRASYWPCPVGQHYFIGPELRDQLRGLALDGRFQAWRLTLWLLPRLRAARAAGETSIAANNSRLSRELRVSETTVQRALRTLCAVGMRLLRVVAVGWHGVRRRARRLAARCGLTTELTPPGSAGNRDLGGQTTEQTAPGSNMNRGGSIDDQVGVTVSVISAPQHTRARAREDESPSAAGDRDPSLSLPERDALEVLSNALGVADTPAGRWLARIAGSASEAERWLDTEGPGIATAYNPAGWLVRAAQHWGSRPDTASAIATARFREVQSQRPDWFGVWLDRRTLRVEPVLEFEPERTEPPATPAAQAALTVLECCEWAAIEADSGRNPAPAVVEAERAWGEVLAAGAQPTEPLARRALVALQSAQALKTKERLDEPVNPPAARPPEQTFQADFAALRRSLFHA